MQNRDDLSNNLPRPEENKNGHEEEQKVHEKNSQENPRANTDNSEASIGSKTAEELVGDILASDPQEDEGGDAMLSGISVGMRQDEGDLSGQLRLRKRVKSSKEAEIANQLPTSKKKSNNSPKVGKGKENELIETLTPTRLLSSSVHEESQEDLYAAIQSNPFEVAQNERDCIEDDDDEILGKESHVQTDQQHVGKEKHDNLDQLIEEEEKMTPQIAEENEDGQEKDTIKVADQEVILAPQSLSISKQRSNSADEKLITPVKSPKKKPKKRILPTLSIFQKTTSTVSTSAAAASEAEPAAVEEEKVIKDASLTTKAQNNKKGGLMSFFSKKKENKEKQAQKEQPDSNMAVSKKSTGGVASRFANLFKTKLKGQKNEKQQQQQQVDQQSEDNKGQKEPPSSSEADTSPEKSDLDTGFRANIDDHLEEENQENQILVGQNRRATDEDEYEDSEETDDEIYSHLEGVDFRPANDDQLLFDTQPQNQYQSPDLEPRRRSNLTCGSGDSREATEGGYGSTPSIGSFDDQDYQQQQRQRSYSEIYGEEYEVQFPEAAATHQFNMRNQSPFNKRQQDQLLMNSNSFPYDKQQQVQQQFDGQPLNMQHRQQYRNSAGYMENQMKYFEALSSGGARTTAAGSQPYMTTGAVGSSEHNNPFAVSRHSDEQNQHMFSNLARNSLFVPSDQANQLEENSERLQRSSGFGSMHPQHGSFINSYSGKYRSDSHNQSTTTAGFPAYNQTQQLRVSEPFTPTYAPHNMGFQIQNVQQQPQQLHHPQPGFMRIGQSEFRPSNQIMGPNQFGGQFQRYSDTNLAVARPPLQSQNFVGTAALMENNRISAPHQMTQFRQESYPEHVRQNSNSSSHQSSIKTQSSRASKKGATGKQDRTSNASRTAQNSAQTCDSALSTSSIGNSSKANKGKRARNKNKEGGKKDDSKDSNLVLASKQTQSLKCICCSRNLTKCLMESQIEQFQNLMPEDRIKSLIQVDQDLKHFSTFDTKKGGGSFPGNPNNSNNNARAGIEGRLKDDIWHECCNCCSQIRKTFLNEMVNHASELCRDQICSKFIQVQISRCQTIEQTQIDAFYAEICKDEDLLFQLESVTSNDKVKEQVESDNGTGSELDTGNPASLMKNVFGNYVIQLIFEKGTPERIEEFYQCMLKQIEKLSFDQYGCRIIQKAIVWLPLEKKKEIIAQFNSKLLIEMMFSEEGNYIVQCIILNLPSEEIQFIIQLVQDQVLDLCRDKRGCRVIQRMLEKFPREDINEPVIQQIINAANDLTPQQYGNYVITHILQNGREEEKIQIIESIMNNIVRFSLYQLGSNVVENCLKGAPLAYREAILERLVEAPLASPSNSTQVSLANLLENQFGNYVIQHAFNLSEMSYKCLFYEKIEQAAIQGHVDRTNTYAKHVYSLIHSFFNNNNDGKTQQPSGQKSSSKMADKGSEESKRRQSQKLSQLEKSSQSSSQNLGGKAASTKEERGGDEDQDLSDDGNNQSPEQANAGGTKRKRRRKRRRGHARKKNQQLCQEDILEELSDSDREDYLQQLTTPVMHQRSHSESLFVFSQSQPKEIGDQEGHKQEEE